MTRVGTLVCGVSWKTSEINHKIGRGNWIYILPKLTFEIIKYVLFVTVNQLLILTMGFLPVKQPSM